MTFTPHTDAQIKEMLKTIDMNSMEELFKEIPKDLIIKGLDANVIGDSLTELEAQQEFAERAKRDAAGLCFIGAGAYQHHIPAAVWQITSRGEFLTAYTPYQAEASQGTLQLLYEYQSMIASLLGLDVSNASLYDGATSLAEAILMAVRCHKKAKSKRILIPTTLHPLYRKAIKTTVSQQGIELIEVPFDKESGKISISTLEKYAPEEFTALVIPQPNFFGVLEDVDALCNFAHQHNAMTIAVVNPTAMALLKEPGSWGNKGADIACGEGQPLGVPLASGGPYFGFIACKEEYVRQMPGRIIGRTVDLDGKTGFALTLQAREQHIRRAKATSNICTNQGLLVTAATIYLSLLGYSGLRKVAEVCHENTKILKELLQKVPGVEIVFDKPFFHEFVIRFSKPVKNVLNELNARGIQAGFSLTEDYPELGESILVCVTETKTMKDLEMYRDQLVKM